MRTVTAVLAVTITTVALAGCGAQGSNGEVPATPAASATTAFLRASAGKIPGSTKASRLKLGHSICKSFKADADWAQVVKSLTDAGAPAEDAGYLIGASVKTLCPQYGDALPTYVTRGQAPTG